MQKDMPTGTTTKAKEAPQDYLNTKKFYRYDIVRIKQHIRNKMSQEEMRNSIHRSQVMGKLWMMYDMYTY